MDRLEKAEEILYRWACKEITSEEVKTELLVLNYTVDLRIWIGNSIELINKDSNLHDIAEI